jgi:hypothetical protein
VFPLGHVGIGTHLIPRKLRDRLPWRWLALGCLLPDLVDKPLWLLAHWLGAKSMVFDSARMIGHTALLAVVLAFAARGLNSPRWLGLSYGVPTHLVLDIITDRGIGFGWGEWKSWLFWPFDFGEVHLLLVPSKPRQLAMELQNVVYIAGEIVGAALLLWDLARKRMRNKSA